MRISEPRARRRIGALVLAATATLGWVGTTLARQVPANYGNVSAPATLQFFESSWANMEHRAADVFIAGYGAVWVPPPGKADTGGFSVGYDQYDRFDLGRPGSRTLYGTEAGLKAAIGVWHRFDAAVYADLVWNHNGFADSSTPGFVAAGDYPGFVTTLPGSIDGDFHSAFAGGDLDGRLSGLIDFNHATNHRFIRSPVTPGDPRNIPGPSAGANGRIADVPDAANRRFYPAQSGAGRTLFDPRTNQWFTVHDFRGDGTELIDGAPVEENALGYLMRNAQWYVQDVGFDGFRLDATKHVEAWVLEYYDRAVYAASPRRNLDGSVRHVFSFGETLDGDFGLLQSRTRKDIDPATPNVVGGNRDALDFPLHFALRANLTNNGLANDWRNVAHASFDRNDDGLANNGTQGVAFDGSHDEFGADLGNVANAYLSMRPGNWVVYHNAHEFGDDRDFPKDGRGDALGGLYGDAITTLVGLRNTHGRGNYRERWLDKEALVYERERSAVVGLNNRVDGGFDERLVQTSFAPGTHLIELTGNAADEAVDPFDDVPEVVTVDASGRIPVRIPRNVAADGGRHDKGYVVYGLATPQGELTLTNVARVLHGGTPTPGTNGTTRLADIDVITADDFEVRLRTVPVNLLGLPGLRDADADGDNAVLRFNAGVDVNGNGGVDHATPDTVVYGFEQFATKSSPLFGGGDGEFRQVVDADDLVEGLNFLEVRAFRHRGDGGPPVYSSLKRIVYVDRFAPESELAGVRRIDGTGEHFRQVQVRNADMTGDSVHVFLNLPSSLTDQQVLAMVNGGNKAGQIDRDLWAYGWDNLPSGHHALTIVTYEVTGNVNVQRIGGIAIADGRGRGAGDLDFDGDHDPGDVAGPGAFEQFLYSRGDQFNPAGDVTADGRIDNRDLYALRPLYQASGATAAAAEARAAELRRGNLNGDAATNAADVDRLFAGLGSGDWLLDLDSDGGAADRQDVDTLVRVIFLSEYGDANLDGRVNLLDFGVLRGHFGLAGGWASGDFTGDGRVNLSDFGLLRQYFGFGAGFGPLAGDLPDRWPGDGLLMTSVPEPTNALWLAGAIAALGRRRRGKRLEPMSRKEDHQADPPPAVGGK